MNLADALIDLTRRAGDAIMQVYAGEFEVQIKADASPLTVADLRAHRIIVDGLHRMTPDLPIISEESEPADFEVRQSWDRYWLVDPLDGTREFVNRNDDFTVNIALIDANRPVMGVVGVPVREEVFYGDVRSGIAYKTTRDGRQTLNTRAVSQAERLTVVASRSHGGPRLERYLDALAAAFGSVARKSVGSSLKFCILAEGLADFYPRLGPHVGVGHGGRAGSADCSRRCRTLFRWLRTRIQHEGVAPESRILLRWRSDFSMGRTPASRIDPSRSVRTDHWPVAKHTTMLTP